MNLFSGLTIFLLYSTIFIVRNDATRLLRRKRDDLFAQLASAVQKLNDLLNANKAVGPDQAPAPTPDLPSVKSLGFCKSNPSSCDYLSCLAQNFQISGQASQVRQGGILMVDPSLRQAVATDPTVSKMACGRANLTDDGCQKFKKFLGAINVIDPLSAHADDEPRDKREVGGAGKNPAHDDYGDKSQRGEKTPTKPPMKDCESIRRQLNQMNAQRPFSGLWR